MEGRARVPPSGRRICTWSATRRRCAAARCRCACFSRLCCRCRWTCTGRHGNADVDADVVVDFDDDDVVVDVDDDAAAVVDAGADDVDGGVVFRCDVGVVGATTTIVRCVVLRHLSCLLRCPTQPLYLTLMLAQSIPQEDSDPTYLSMCGDKECSEVDGECTRHVSSTALPHVRVLMNARRSTIPFLFFPLFFLLLLFLLFPLFFSSSLRPLPREPNMPSHARSTQILWETKYGCPVCSLSSFVELGTACSRGFRNVSFEYAQECFGGMALPGDQTRVRCVLVSDFSICCRVLTCALVAVRFLASLCALAVGCARRMVVFSPDTLSCQVVI